MSSQGIQTLLDAEKEAEKIVVKSRQYRMQRLKDAKTEAIKEIDLLKAEKNAEFLNFVKQYLGTSDEAVKKVDSETEQSLKQIQENYRANKNKVIEKLLRAVGTVKPELHPNAKVRL